jgi:hypothetical protein
MVNEATSPVTLDRIARNAARIYRFRLVFFAIAAGAGVWFAASLADGGDSTQSLLALTVLLWSVLALGAGYTLLQSPPAVAPGAAPLARLRIHALRAAYWLALAVLLGLATGAILLTWRALGLAFAAS